VSLPRVRRTEHLVFYCFDGQFPDIPALLRGVVELAPVQQLYAISILTGAEHLIDREELAVLLSIPSDRWISADELIGRGEMDGDHIERYTRRGILVSDDPSEPFRTLRARDEELSTTPWNLYASLYHSTRKWQGVRIDRIEAEHGQAGLDDLVGKHGPPPGHFHSVGEAASVPLPDGRRDGDLYRTLLTRRTARSFASETPLDAADLSSVLRYVFGCQGYSALGDDVWLLKKTSPSGGAMHSTEVYPLLRRVAGFESGLYHYSVERHELELMRCMSEAEVEDLAVLVTAGQAYVSGAQALFLLTARFPRSFWKYRRHEKAYAAILMDVGHLSQTFYLVCTDLGLGPFVTAAINERDIEEALGIDGFAEGAVAVLGCGIPGPSDPSRDPVFQPYTPAPSRR
jgi:putative peptide maturation dehydrogenase